MLCIIGLGIFIMGARMWYKQWNLMKKCTRPTNGIITGIKKREIPVSPKKGPASAKTHNLEYEYSVNDIKYRREAQYPKTESYAKSMVGLKVTLYYDINNPGNSFLLQEKTAEYTAMLITAAGIVIMLFSYANFT